MNGIGHPTDAESLIDLKTLRKLFKSIGYRLKTTRHSEFIWVGIVPPDGQQLGQIMTREEYDKFKPAIDMRAQYKGKVFEGSMRCVM